MRMMDGIRRSGVALAPDRTVQEAAAVMEKAGVGSIVVIDRDRIVGIVTDRDLVRRVLAVGRETDARLDSVMTAPVVTIAADADLHDAFAQFRTHGLRRLVVERDGQFVGMITVDDLLVDVASDLADLARPVTGEVLFGQRDAAVPAFR